MKTGVSRGGVLLALLTLSAVAGSAADSKTYISNESRRTILATTSYFSSVAGIPVEVGHSQFINRVIHPGEFQVDPYGSFVNSVNINLWVDGSRFSNTVEVWFDHSIVAYDNRDGFSIDIFLAKYGSRVIIDHPQFRPLTTIYP